MGVLQVPDAAVFQRSAELESHHRSYHAPQPPPGETSTTLGVVLMHRKEQVSYSAGLFGTPRCVDIHKFMRLYT